MVIEIESLTKVYRDGTQAIKNLCLCVPTGSILGFLGPNGAGKTTTIRLILGLLRPTSGSIQVNGFDPVSQGAAVRSMIGYLPENFGLYEEMDANSLLKYTADLLQIPRNQQRVRVEALLKRFSLWGQRHKKLSTYSKGMRQKFAFARALLDDPPILLLDEPTNGLDPQATQSVRTLLDELRDRKRTVVLTTHLLDEVERLCDLVVILHGGRIRFESSLDALRQQQVLHIKTYSQQQSVVPALQTAFPVVERVETLDNQLRLFTQDSVALAPQLNRWLVERGVDVVDLHHEHQNLEEVYLRVVGPPA